MMRVRLGTGLLLAAVFLLCPFTPVSANEGAVYTLGVIPSAPPVATHTQWAPFVERLSRDTGLAFRLKVYETMADFEQDIVSAKAPDLLFANSLQIVVAHQAQGYVPLVRGSGRVWVELFVRKDSPARTIEDLSGKKIAFVGAKNL